MKKNEAAHLHPGMREMIKDIEHEVDTTRHLIGRDALDARVMSAMVEVPRDHFVPQESRGYSFDNRPLSIGHGQTISQPYIVALMTDLLQPQSDHTILEIGTGSGYQAAVLSRLVKQVHTIEIIEPMAEVAQAKLEALNYDNVKLHVGDGYEGFAAFGPYDGIVVTAAAPRIPPPLIEQLKPGGRLVIPIGYPYSTQVLMVVEKSDNGEISQQDVLAVAFVPLTGTHGAVGAI